MRRPFGATYAVIGDGTAWRSPGRATRHTSAGQLGVERRAVAGAALRRADRPARAWCASFVSCTFGLIECVHPEEMAGDRGRDLPAHELAGQIVGVARAHRHDRMARARVRRRADRPPPLPTCIATNGRSLP